jgi:RHS repeat-associated protein
MDYAYTLQGWIKGVNAAALNETKEIGLDGAAANINQYVARDAYAYAIGYNATDYKNIDPAQVFDPTQASSFGTDAFSLYNGNIRNISQQNRKLVDGALTTAYRYDQLNRIKNAQRFSGLNTTTWASTLATNTKHKENGIVYDANGNILNFQRNQETSLLMDNLTYNYYPNSNKLSSVSDAVASTVSTLDIDTQAADNYLYDGSGNLIEDKSEKLTVQWSPYGKVKSLVRIIPKTATIFKPFETNYGYDAAQNRVMKRTNESGDTTRTFYIRDAQGNVMSVYTLRFGVYTWTEQHLYGSSRIGLSEPKVAWNTVGVATTNPMYVVMYNGPGIDTSKYYLHLEGNKRYEISNHLGNVMSVITDRKRGAGVSAGAYTYYLPAVLSASDYYAFGMEMPGRTYSAGAYRYGFNGKENDRGNFGTQLVQDYGMRLYNPAIGKFLSVDPIARQYPWYTPYQFAGNKPIIAIDLDGAEELIVIHRFSRNSQGDLFKVRDVEIKRGEYHSWEGSYYDFAIAPSADGRMDMYYYDNNLIKVNATLVEKQTQKGGIAFTLQINDETSHILQEKEDRIAEDFEIVDIDKLLQLIGTAKDANMWKPPSFFKDLSDYLKPAPLIEKINQFVVNVDNYYDAKGAIETIKNELQASEAVLLAKKEPQLTPWVYKGFKPDKFPSPKNKQGKDTVTRKGYDYYNNGQKDSTNRSKGRFARETNIKEDKSSNSSVKPLQEQHE